VPVFPTAIVTTVADPKAFRSGREFAAWLGLVPRQNSTGGKTRLGGITKRGNRYLRRLLINGASANLLRSKATKADRPRSSTTPTEGESSPGVTGTFCAS
jgi:transposase